MQLSLRKTAKVTQAAIVAKVLKGVLKGIKARLRWQLE